MSLSGTPYIILGMHRAGTSVVAHVLRELGLNLGESKDFIAANEFNAGGYWENEWLVGANEAFMADLGLIWDRTQLCPDNWRDYPRTEFHLNHLSSTLARIFGGSLRWGWKDPRTTLLLPAYRELFAREGLSPFYVICIRHPAAVARSLARRDGASEASAVGLWLLYTLVALHETQGTRRAVVSYESLLRDPKGSLRAVCDAWELLPVDWDRAASVVRRDLDHGGEPNLEAGYPDVVDRTWRLVSRAAAEPDAFANGAWDEEIKVLWDEFRAWWMLQKFIPSGFGLFVLQFSTGTQITTTTTGFHAHPTWQPLEADLDAAGGTQVMGGFGHMVGNIWVRGVQVVDSAGRPMPLELKAGRGAFLDLDGQGMGRFMTHTNVDQFSFRLPEAKGPFRLKMEIATDFSANAAADVARRLASGPS